MNFSGEFLPKKLIGDDRVSEYTTQLQITSAISTLNSMTSGQITHLKFNKPLLPEDLLLLHVDADVTLVGVPYPQKDIYGKPVIYYCFRKN